MLVSASPGCALASTTRAPRSSSAARMRSARSGSSVPGVLTPTQISPPGSCRRCRSLHTTGMASPTGASLSGELVRTLGADPRGLILRREALAVERDVDAVEFPERDGVRLDLAQEVLEAPPAGRLARHDPLAHRRGRGLQPDQQVIVRADALEEPRQVSVRLHDLAEEQHFLPHPPVPLPRIAQ